MRNFQYFDGTSPVLIHAPHGGKHIPDLAWGSLTVNEQEVKQELLAMTDGHTDRMAHDISAHGYAYEHGLMASRFVNNLSRLVVDPERFPDETEEMNSVGMGAVYTHGSQKQRIRVTNKEIADRLLDLYFKPYSLALSYHVDDLLNRFGKMAILDLHSFASKALPYEIHQEQKRPQICLGIDSSHIDPEISREVQESLEADGYWVEINQPFSGTYVPLKHYQVTKKVSSLMLEIRRDIYMDEFTGEIIQQDYKRLVKSLSKVAEILART